jgi:hypothetical protein
MKEAHNLFVQATDILLYPIAICLFFAIVIGVFELIVSRRWKNFDQASWKFFFVGLPIALLGYLIGFMVGDSRTGEIGSLVTGVLGAIAGLNIFVENSDRRKSAFTGYSVCLLAVTIFVGTLHGAIRRESVFEEHLQNLSDQELRIRNNRKNLGLPEDFPGWMVPGSDTK